MTIMNNNGYETHTKLNMCIQLNLQPLTAYLW